MTLAGELMGRRKYNSRRGGRPKATVPALDRGTPELQAQRARLVGPTADPALSVSSLSVFRARGFISPAQERGGTSYAKLRWALFGSGTVQVGPQFGRELSLEAEAQLRAAYEAADRALRQAGPDAHREVVQVAVFGWLPEWFLHDQARIGDPERYAALLLGLQVLARHFGD